MVTSSSGAPESFAKLAFASAVGTTLEWYDFTVYNVLAALVFNAVFFPTFDPLAGTLLAFSTYAVGYLSRPFGGFVFGHLGDRIGRRRVLALTLIVMGVASACIGALPSYAHVGLASPAALVVLRFIQGAAVGGEWAGAVLLALEHGSSRHRGRNGSFAQLGPALGTILGTGIVAAVTLGTTSAQFEAWGWRLPFALSVGLVFFGVWVRHRVAETPVFLRLESTHARIAAPLREVGRAHGAAVLRSIGARIGPDVTYGLITAFTLTYLVNLQHLARPPALLVMLLGSVCHAVFIPLFASWSDRWGRRPVQAIGAAGMLMWLTAYFHWLDMRAWLPIGFALAGAFVLHAAMYGPQAAFIAEQFPVRVRYAGASVSYTLTSVIAGGPAPLIFAALYKAHRSTFFIVLYAAVALLVTGAALWRARETARVPLE